MKDWLRVEIRLHQDNTIESKLEDAGFNVPEHNTREGRYKLRLIKADLDKHHEFISDLLKSARGDYQD